MWFCTLMQAHTFGVIFIVYIFVSGNNEITEKISLNDDGDFVNSRGHRIIFHGFNSVFKAPPFYNAEDSGGERLKYFKQWGFNAVRLGVIWHATMPTRVGGINATYLDQIEAQVDSFSKYGIYVILDMHQDSLSTMYGSYDAVPKWLLQDFPQPSWPFRYPWPMWKRPIGDWQGYTTYACQKAFQCIYDNNSNAWGFWGDFWEAVAKRFKSKTNVLGYELMNEPFAGNIYANPLRGIPSYAGRHNLMPMYDYLVKRIRAVDREKFVFFEGVTWSVYGNLDNGGIFGDGFEHVPGFREDPTEIRRSVFSYHYYCPLISLEDPAKEYPNWKRIGCDEVIMPRMFTAVNETTKRLRSGRFLTEFGICVPDGNRNSINTIECNAVLNGADSKFQSWTYWDAKFFNENNEFQLNATKPFARVYARRTAGVPLTLMFNVIEGSAFYSFLTNEITSMTANKGISIAEIFLPIEMHYPSGYTVGVNPHTIRYRVSTEYDHILELIAPDEGLAHHTLVEINVKARQ